MKVYSSKVWTAFFLLVFMITDLHAQENKRPNILLILADDLGYGDLSCLGGKDVLTPNIDQLANKGLQFINFYANSTVCSPTRASLLSGKYPDMVGVPGVIRQEKKIHGDILAKGLNSYHPFYRKTSIILRLLANGIWDSSNQTYQMREDFSCSKVFWVT